MVAPSVPAIGCGLIVTVATLVSLIQGAVPNNVYSKVLVVAPTAGVNVPAAALKAPPVPPVLVQVPPICSPVIKVDKVIAVVDVSQIVIPPSTPATGCALIFTVAILVSLIHGAVPNKVYSKVLVVAPTAGVNVPAATLNAPPVPVSLTQVPPDCSAVINVAKLIAVANVSQTVVAPSNPATGCALIVTVATLVSLIHGAVPNKVYSKVLVVAPRAGVNVPAAALKDPPVPPVLVQVPPICSPVINVDKVIAVVDVSQIVIPPSTPATGCALIVIVATLESLIHGAVPDNV